MATVWPAEDDFSDGSPAYPDYLTPYLKVDPWGTDAGSGFGANMLPFIQSGICHIYSGWSRSIKAGAPIFENSTPLVVTRSSTSATDFRPAGFMPRTTLLLDCSVSLSFFERAATGAPITHRQYYVGVGARVQGGTSASSGGEDFRRISNPDGYWFFLGVWSNSSLYRWVLGRCTGGTFTTLATSTTTLAALELNKPRRLRMRVEGTTNPHIVCETRGTTVPVSGPEWTTVFDYTDSVSGKITTIGRPAFFTTGEHRLSSPIDNVIRAIVINYFQASSNFAGTAVAYRDDGKRLLTSAGEAVTGISGSGFSGYSLLNGWFGDLWGSASFERKMRRDSGNNRILFNPSDTLTPGFFLSQRPADSPTFQDREAVFRFVTGTSTATRRVGIALRVSQSAPASDPSACYYATLERNDAAGTGSVRLYRKRQNHLAIAEKTGVTLNEATDYTLRFQVSNLSIPDPATGYCRLKVWLNGTQVVLVALPVNGMVSYADGTVDDTSAGRVQSGPGEGVFIDLPSGSDRNATVDSWAIGSASTDVPENNQASIAVLAEDDGATGTLNIPLDWDIQYLRSSRATEIPLEGGYVYRNAASTARLRRGYRVQARAATEAERDTLIAFWDSHRGCEIPFSWVNPYVETITMRFVEDSLVDRLIAPGVYELGFEMEEQFDGT